MLLGGCISDGDGSHHGHDSHGLRQSATDAANTLYDGLAGSNNW
jgi:hypothetical protein